MANEHAQNREESANFEKLMKIVYSIGILLTKPDVLNDREKLMKFDRHHIELYEANDFGLHGQYNWLNPIHLL